MSIASAFGLNGRPDERQGSRTRVLLPAVLLAAGRPSRIHLLDVSHKGALAHAVEPPPPGEIVWLVCRGSEVLARTAWVRGRRFGLAFDSRLPTAKLKLLLAEGARALEVESAEPSLRLTGS